ncbi:MAG: hypothetical protein GY913_31325 [Proteobacteria bacterium]|nr:hypothetical protein [Pseudomonadota bacterium]MCP4921411.1 hypothetical protein [Pseudomonadota bacterium]
MQIWKPVLAGLLTFGVALGSAVFAPSEAHAQDVPRTQWLDVEVGQSSIQKSSRPFARVLISDPDVAEIKLLEEGQFSIRGLAVGSTDLWVWYRDDTEHPEVFELTVHRDLSDLIRHSAELVTDGAPPRVYPLEDRIVVEGTVPDLLTLERIAAIAEVYDEDFVNLMTVRGDHQVQLEVVFAEVSRSAVREMGLNVIWGNDVAGANMVSPATTGDRGIAQHPHVVTGGTEPIELLNAGTIASAGSGAYSLMGVLGDPVNMAAILSVLEDNSMTKILAEPTLVALSGQQAEFLAGGEIPIPVSQNNNRITLQFKEYGVKLVFVPTVLGDGVIDLRTYVEVSEIDSATATRITGIEIPGFITRKADSHLRMSNGMTFAMAGLLSETTRYSRAEVPVLGEIPLIGMLFSYTKHDRDETELMIFVTPRLVRPMAADEVPLPPGATEDNNPNDFELFLLGMDHRAGSRSSEPTGNVGMER